MIYTGTYANIKKRLNDWLNAIGGEVSDLALDLANRGRVKVWMESDWEHLLKRQALTVDPATKRSTLPADFGKIINIYFDPLGYDKPIGYYTKDGDLIYGYKIQFDTALPTNPPYVQWFLGPIFNPTLTYKQALTTLAGVVDPEYLFFPEELVLRAAQLCHITENGIGNTEYQLIEREYAKELYRFKSQVQGVNADQRQEVKDDAGNKVRVSSLDLSGNTTVQRAFSPSLDYPKFGAY